MDIFLCLAVIYIFVIFILSRLVIPHLGFKDEKMPERIPQSMIDKINQLKSQSKSQEEFLKLSYDYLGSKFITGRFNTILKFNYLFKSIEQSWGIEGFMPCTISNYILKIFLIKSGWFKEKDIKRRHVFLNFILHQYLQVKVNDKWLDVDVGEKQRDMPIGKYLKLFG